MKNVFAIRRMARSRTSRFLILVGLLSGGPAFSDPPDPEGLQEIVAAAIAEPGSESKFEAFKASLPQSDDGRFIVEGDLVMTETDLRFYLEELGRLPSLPEGQAPELLISKVNGAPSYWPTGQRKLTYFVADSSFRSPAEASATAGFLNTAARDWEATCPECGIQFERVDDSTKALFTVAYVEGSEPIAQAFFPSWSPSQRRLEVFDPFFSDTLIFDKVGVLRHELGHVLGYVHEQARGVPGCAKEGTGFIALTKYDSKSVMHYLCGGMGDQELKITSTDVAGHQCVYLHGGPPCAPADEKNAGIATVEMKDLQARFEKVSVRFQGRNIADHWAQLAEELLFGKEASGGQPAIALRTVQLGSGRATLCEVYLEELHIPGCSAAVQRLALRLNPGPLTSDSLVQMPDLPLDSASWVKVYDTEIESERIELARHRSEWKESNVEFATYQRGDLVRQTYPGFKIEKTLATSEADAMESAFYAAAIPKANLLRDTVRSPELYSVSFRPAPDHALLCRGGSSTIEKGSYAAMLGSHDRPATCRENCPVVILVDTSLYRHPSLLPALLPPAQSDSAPPSAFDPFCAYVPQFRRENHGTHLAGIMVGRDVPGAHFVGLAQDAMLYSVVWNQDDQDSLLETMERVEADDELSNRPQIWVFASQFPYNKGALSEAATFSLDDDQVRLREPAAAREILNRQLLWITAAGQPVEDNKKRQEIERTKALSPMNLGDQNSVIVVTACDTCTGDDPTLWSGANFGNPDLINIAAPGGQMIPGLATADKYGEAQGTSQAVAFVGGVAAMMISEYPKFYQRHYRLKRRLQATATPVVHEGDYVSSGVVNPDLATCDPRMDWFVEAGGIGSAEAGKSCAGHQEIEAVRFCDKFIDLEGPGQPVRTSEIHRIVKVVPVDGRDRWVFYTYKYEPQDPTTLSQIVKKGPATLLAGIDPWVAQITEPGRPARSIRLSEVEDLLLANSGAGLVKCEP